jgi:hypothetical protein
MNDYKPDRITGKPGLVNPLTPPLVLSSIMQVNLLSKSEVFHYQSLWQSLGLLNELRVTRTVLY